MSADIYKKVGVIKIFNNMKIAKKLILSFILVVLTPSIASAVGVSLLSKLVVAILAIAMGLLVSRGISRPVKTCAERLVLLSQGNLHIGVAGKGFAVVASGEQATSISQVNILRSSVTEHKNDISDLVPNWSKVAFAFDKNLQSITGIIKIQLNRQGELSLPFPKERDEIRHPCATPSLTDQRGRYGLWNLRRPMPHAF